MTAVEFHGVVASVAVKAARISQIGWLRLIDVLLLRSDHLAGLLQNPVQAV